MDQSFKDKLKAIVLEKNSKEYACHLQYAVEIGIKLAKKNSVDPELMEIACLLHDIGRDNELEGEDHAETGYRIGKEILANGPLSEEEIEIIVSAIRSHSSDSVPETITEQIVRSADAGSKVEYHEAFILMCKKQTYEERLAWCKKYLDTGYSKISFPEYKEQLTAKYDSISAIYQATLKAIQENSASN